MADGPTVTVQWNQTSGLQALVTQFRAAAVQALREQGEVMMTEAKKRTPVRTGNLRASGTVTQSEDGMTVTLSFGGPAAPYAVYVHENLEAHHPVGQAKFLESVVTEESPGLGEAILQRIRSITGG